MGKGSPPPVATLLGFKTILMFPGQVSRLDSIQSTANPGNIRKELKTAASVTLPAHTTVTEWKAGDNQSSDTLQCHLWKPGRPRCLGKVQRERSWAWPAEGDGPSTAGAQGTEQTPTGSQSPHRPPRRRGKLPRLGAHRNQARTGPGKAGELEQAGAPRRLHRHAGPPRKEWASKLASRPLTVGGALLTGLRFHRASGSQMCTSGPPQECRPVSGHQGCWGLCPRRRASVTHVFTRSFTQQELICICGDPLAGLDNTRSERECFSLPSLPGSSSATLH